jgi:hypothetical protein
MSWITTFAFPNNQHWTFNNTYSGLTRTAISPNILTSALSYVSNSNIRFSPEKNYIFITKVDNFDIAQNYKRLRIEAFGTSFSYFSASTAPLSTLPLSGDSLNDIDLIWQVSPTNTLNTTTLARYRANYNDFGTHSGSSTASVIKNLSVIEIDWKIQGWSIAISSTTSNERYEGWRYQTDDSFKFYHSTKTGGLNFSYRKPAFGHTSSNYVSKLIPYDEFNLEFQFDTNNTTNGYLEIYLTDTLPSNSTILSTFTASLALGQKIATVTQDGIYNFYRLTGNRYLSFVANYSNLNQNYQVEVSNIKVQGGYSQTDNNERFLFTNSNSYNEPTTLAIIGGATDSSYSTITTTLQTQHFTNSNFFGATGNPGFFSTIYGSVVNLSQQVSKIGNGTFRSGIWENGVWNSGWRVDENIWEMNDVVVAFPLRTKNNRWRIQISGPTSSIANFQIGERVSISNIVSINLNEGRKLLRNSYTIVEKDDNNLVVEIDNIFPIRRIEKDSPNHKIRITKNVWLNGGFFNGYFEGIWNNGLFKGYPFITEMYNTHWIDGTFDGGYFNSFYPTYRFTDTLYTNGNVGLSFSQPHGFIIGDEVEIDKDNKTINPLYDTKAKVTSIIDDFYIVTDIPWGSNSVLESGVVKRATATGLIQNFNFFDNNVASKTSKQTTEKKDIWKFNSWIDVNFSTHSSTNINRQRTFYNDFPNSPLDFFILKKYGLGEFGALNLYGYITNDVLSSDSSFRDIDSLSKKKYSLGTKYEIYQDFLGNISEFNEPFGSGGQFGGETNFFLNGWTYSFSGTFSIPTPTPFTFSRTSDGTLLFEFFESLSQGVVLDNQNISIEKNRYSLIEFDLLRDESILGGSSINLFNEPIFIGQNGNFQGPTAAFPVGDKVNYLETPDIRKREFFYNRLSLDLGLISVQGSIIELDNIKFYEVDAIPFFQYTTDEYVNISVQVPYQGLAPFIDYENANFSYVENITIGFDSIVINATNNTVVQQSTLPIAYINTNLIAGQINA